MTKQPDTAGGPQSLGAILKRIGNDVADRDVGSSGDANQRRLIDASVDIAMGDPGQILFQHTIFCQCSLPYRDPGIDTLTWTRQNGSVSLHIRAGEVEHPNGQWKPIGLPFGPKPRLILMHLNGEALRQKSRHIEIDRTLSAFVRRIGLPSKGKNISSVKTHVGRLANAEIRLAGQLPGTDRRGQVNTHIVSGFDLWFTEDEHQQVLWPGHVVLSKEYFESLTQHAVPLSEKAIAGLRNNTMALDIYSWLAQRLHRVSKHSGIPWPVLQAQFGHNYTQLRDFRRAFNQSLKKVKLVYPRANVSVDHRGVQLYPSPPPIAKRFVAVK